VKGKPDIIDIIEKKRPLWSKGCQRREEKEDVQDKRGWKDYK
jgi:hypothetical protein